MKIVLIGAGNLATNLGKALLSAGHDIVQVLVEPWSRLLPWLRLQEGHL